MILGVSFEKMMFFFFHFHFSHFGSFWHRFSMILASFGVLLAPLAFLGFV